MGEQGRQEDRKHTQITSYDLIPSLTRSKIQPGSIEVSSVASRVSNGEVWILKGVLNYQ